jgi:hypothetical protein
MTADSAFSRRDSGNALRGRGGRHRDPEQGEWGEGVGPGTPVDVEVRAPAVKHQLTLMQIRRRYNGVVVSPDEVLKRQPVRTLIE